MASPSRDRPSTDPPSKDRPTPGPPGTGTLAPWRRAFVALGSNLGDRLAHLRAGARALPDVVAASSVYETEPVGGPEGQGPYLNAVVELRTSALPGQLLTVARAAEATEGRTRTVRWGPRTLDVDILMVGDLRARSEELEIPHPRMWERGFVLVPLAELAPELVAGRLTAQMAAGVRKTPGSVWP